MQTFRKKYIYNADNPIYSSQTARTYNCMNTETKDKKLIIIHHLKQPPFVQPSTGVLQPVEIPTTIQPFSVYPIVRCVSQIGKIAEPEAMYILKCIFQCKLSKPLYYTISNQGICCSDVEGILPNRSPQIFQLTIDLLDLPANLQQVEKSIVSKQGYSICRMIKNGDNPLVSLQNYGWKDIKKQRQQVVDKDFIVFKGRRKEDGPFGEEYGLAWHNQFGLCRMKYINLIRDGYQEQFYKQFMDAIEYIKKMDTSEQKPLFLKVYKQQKDESKGIKIFTQLANQGSLTQYIAKKNQTNQLITQKNYAHILDVFIQNMIKLSKELEAKGLGTLHIKSFYVHNHRICLGEPLFITDKGQKKLRQLKNSMDYFAPEFKENIILPANLKKLNREKTDIWSFGFILHKLFTKQIPIFDANKKPTILTKQLSAGLVELISKCLDLDPEKRPTWSMINMKQLQAKRVILQQVQQQKQQNQRIKLGTRLQRSSSQKRSITKNERSPIQQNQQILLQKSQMQQQKQEQQLKLKQQQQQQQLQFIIPVPTEISSRLKKIKLVIKIIVVMLLYIFVYFRVFLGNTINILSVRSFYTTAALKLVDYGGNQLSTISVITNDPIFFLKNDISFTDIQQQYQCINDKFDPIYNPDYSLLSYIHSAGFLILILSSWAAALVICTIKAISIWKGGISNRPLRKQGRFWASYIFHQLTLAALLFTHFYLFEFFYFAGATPCLNLLTFSGLQPVFDSSLFLFLSNSDGYFRQVFSTLGILSIFLVVSTCFYAWGPKLQNRYFISVPSILLRMIPFILLLLICRIGIFMLFTPTAINDSTKILPTIVKGSFQGLVGIIPQIFILITISVQVVIELFMYWCERKAAQSDQLSKLFNIKDKKVSINNDISRLNDMSLVNNSMNKLDISSVQQV